MKKAVLKIAAGTVVGREHARAGRNNQDAYAVWHTDDLTVAVVCDGCGSAPHSEVGAKLMAPALVRRLAERGWNNAGREVNLAVAQALLLDHLMALADGMGERKQVAHDYFLGTILGMVATDTEVVVFGLGDGVYMINGEKKALHFEGNAPPYLAYAMMGKASIPFTVHAVLPLDEFESVLIASDGAEEIDELAQTTLPGKKEAMGGTGSVRKR